MRAFKLAAILLILIAVPALFSSAARADELTEGTLLTFSRPVQIPGDRILPAGSYWFRLIDLENSEDIVAIYNADQTRVEAVLLTRPIPRRFRRYATEVTLAQAAQNPDVLLSWCYPGREYGHQFLYSRRMQRRLRQEPEVTEFVRGGYVQ